MDDQMNHVCKVVGVGAKGRRWMEASGLCAVADLLQIHSTIQKGALKHLLEKDRRSLLVAAEWVDKNPHADIAKDFTADVYEMLCWAKEYVNILGRPFDEGTLPIHEDVDDDTLEVVIDLCKGAIMESSNLLAKVGNFDHELFLEKVLRHFHGILGQAGGVPEKKFIVAGRTQSGKSAIKGIVQSLCGLLKIPCVIVTKVSSGAATLATNATSFDFSELFF